ncbi:NEP4-like protein [Mya arenaria]|uniref:NEP4-like protein n=1 Tax=Mya arenaria TaxID=6604 RepID=A0ABY7F0L5_MYAAR|nr:NEP4-like protein [Mya arenaria]
MSIPALIDERDLNPALDFLDELGGWPVAEGEDWREDEFDLIELLAKLRLYNNKILLDQWVGSDDKNSERYIIQVDQPELGMSSRDYYTKGVDDPHIKAYMQYATDFTIPQEDRRDSEALYNKMTIAELQQMIPNFEWVRYLQGIFSRVGLNIAESEEIVVYAPEYLANMATLVQETDKRTLANYLIWRIMMNRIENLPNKYRDLDSEYHKILYGSRSETSRWRYCVTYVNNNLGNAVGRLFINKHFDETAKQSALEMIKDIRIAFNELLSEVDWMDEKTRELAKEKADAMAVQIGYPSYILNDTVLNEEYKHVDFRPDTYFENILENIHGIAISNLEMIHKPVDRNLWSTYPAVVNAFYSSAKNQITGILQPPFYSKGYPKSINYGGIGMVIGHEITHGFDDRGRQYDKNGNLKQWWDDHVIAEFKERAQCIVDQYGNYTIEDDLQVNGIQTQGENIADNGGLKESYKAYQKWKKDHGGSEPKLPGLTNLNNDQLFFLNFAQGLSVSKKIKRFQQTLKAIIRCGADQPDQSR